MTEETILLDRRDAVAVITVNRPEARNALTSAMRDQLLSICRELERDPGLRVVALRGAGGKSFVSGADIGEFAQQRTTADFLAMARLEETLAQAVERLPVATVAIIEGYALGGGMMLAALCDLRVCTADSRFGITSAKNLGNCLSPGMYARLAALIGPGRVKELLIGAPMLTAEEAHAWGLVTEVVERDALETRVSELLEQLSRNAPLTVWAAKESMRRLTAGFPLDEDIMEKVLGSEDFHEGVAAFLEKRAPRWRNR